MSRAAVEPAFRRATEADAVALARETFLADERVDMNALAQRLGVSRATLHRWVHTREQLLDRVLGDLAQEFFDEGLERARDHPDHAVAELARTLVAATASAPPLRGFVAREPELALRLMLSPEGSVRRRAVAGVQALVDAVHADEREQLAGFSEAMIDVALPMEWAMLIAGVEPSAERIAQVARALLAGARAGELRAPARRR